MTVFAKSTAYGLESKIKDAQSVLNTYLSSKWSGTLHIYGLIDRNLKNGVFIPEAYDDKEYKQIFVNDKVSGTIGFYVTNRDYSDFMPSASVDAIFTVNIKDIHGNDLRNKDLAQIQARDALLKTGAFTIIGDIKEGIEEVFADFDQEQIKYRDMHPFYIFSFECELTYSSKNNDCELG